MLASETVFEYLKMDLNYVSNENVTKHDHIEEREEVNEGIRAATDMMFVFDPKTHTTVLKKEFEDELNA